MRGIANALVQVMADNTNKNSQDQQRQRTAQQGQGADIGKSAQKGSAPTAGNRDNNTGGKMLPDRETSSNDQLDVDVGDEKSSQRAPQPGTGNRNQ